MIDAFGKVVYISPAFTSFETSGVHASVAQG